MQLTAVAKKGIAKEHAKWSPVAVATYKYEPIIEINEDVERQLTPEQRAEFVEICPAKVSHNLSSPPSPPFPLPLPPLFFFWLSENRS